MLSRKIYTSSALVFLLASQSVLAKPENVYGPVYSGQTLWGIAAEVRPDDSVSIIQLAYSLYDLNPKAFDSGNMNLLKKGVYLKMPDKEKVLSMTRQQARVIFKQHSQALLSLRAGAGYLNKAKANRAKYRKQVKQLQRKLGGLRHKSRAWNKVYLQLVKSKRRKRRWDNKVADIRKALIAKAINPEPEPKAISKQPSTLGSPQSSDLSSLNERMDRLQLVVTKLQEKLEASNKSLEEKVKAQAAMEQRFTLLENELGKKEKIILKLRSTLRVAATTMKKQQIENKALNKRIRELDPNYKPVSAKPSLKLQSASTDSKENPQASATGAVKAESATVESVPKLAAKAEGVAEARTAKKSAPTPVEITKTTTIAEPTVSKATIAKVAQPVTPSALTKKANATKPSAKKALSRDEKRRLRMMKANQANGQSFTSIAFWKNLITKNPMVIGAIIGVLVLLIVSYMVIGNRRRKKLKANALADKHSDLVTAAGKLSDINTSDNNVSQMDLKKTG